MASSVLEELLIQLRVDDGRMKSELAQVITQARKAGQEGERALKPFTTSLERMRAEVKAGIRPLSEYREELKRQERALKDTASSQDKATGEYKKTVTELANVKRELASVTTELKTQETVYNKLGGSLTRLGGILSIGVTAPLTVLGATGARSAMQLEVFQQSLTTLIGNAEDAKRVFNELYEFDTSTTFKWTSLTKATTLLAAFNVQADDLIPTLGRLGDIAAGVNMNIDELAEIYGKAKVQGRLFMEDINQLTGRGIPIIQELARQFGVTEDKVRGLVETGQVGFANIEQAFVSLTSEGGRFFNLMASQVDTTQGKIQSLRKEFEQITDLLGQSLLPTIDRLVGAARGAVEWFTNLDEGTQKLIINTGLFAAALGPLALGLGQVIIMAGRLQVAMTLLGTLGIAPLIGTAGLLAALGIGTGALIGTLITQKTQIDGLVDAYATYRGELRITSEAERQAAIDRLETMKREMQTKLANLKELAESQRQSVQGFIDSPIGRFLLPGFIDVKGSANYQTIEDIAGLRSAIASMNADIGRIESGAATLVDSGGAENGNVGNGSGNGGGGGSESQRTAEDIAAAVARSVAARLAAEADLGGDPFGRSGANMRALFRLQFDRHDFGGGYTSTLRQRDLQDAVDREQQRRADRLKRENDRAQRMLPHRHAAEQGVIDAQLQFQKIMSGELVAQAAYGGFQNRDLVRGDGGLAEAARINYSQRTSYTARLQLREANAAAAKQRQLEAARLERENAREARVAEMRITASQGVIAAQLQFQQIMAGELVAQHAYGGFFNRDRQRMATEGPMLLETARVNYRQSGGSFTTRMQDRNRSDGYQLRQAADILAKKQTDAALQFASTVVGAGRGFASAIGAFQAGNTGGGVSGLFGAAGGVLGILSNPLVGAVSGGTATLVSGILGLVGPLLGDLINLGGGTAVRPAPKGGLFGLERQSLINPDIALAIGSSQASLGPAISSKILDAGNLFMGAAGRIDVAADKFAAAARRLDKGGKGASVGRGSFALSDALKP